MLKETMVLTIWELRKGLKHPDLDKAYEATDNYFTLKLHYGGVFTKVPGRKYKNGNVAYFDFVDIDLFSVHDINEMVRDIGYLTETPLFYQYCKPNICLDYGLMPLGNDQDVLTMTAYIPTHREISVYIETGETTTFIYDKSPSKVIIEELDEPTQVSPEMDPVIKWSRGGKGSCSKKLKLVDHLAESSQPQSQVINDGVWDPNGKDLVPVVSTQVSQVSQVISPQVEALVEVVVQGVGKEPEKGAEPDKGDEVNVVNEPVVDEVVIEDVDPDIGSGNEQILGQQVENDMFAELEDMVGHDYSMIGHIDAQELLIEPTEDEITHEEQGEEEGEGEGVGDCEGEGEGEDSRDTDYFEQDSNLHFDVDVDEHGILSGAKNVESFDNLDDELRPVDLDGGQFAGFAQDERKRMLMELNRPSTCSEGVVHTKPFIACQLFKTKEDVKSLVRLHAVNSRRALHLAKNDKIRVRITCKGVVGESGDGSGGPATRSKVKGKGKGVINNQSKCPWAVQISRSNENEDWMVKTVNDHHKCLQTRDVKSCTSKFLADNIFQQIQSNPSIPIKALHEELTVKIQLGLSKQKVARAKRMTAKVISGDYQSWTWFLELLGEDLNLGPRSNFTFISDRQKRAMDELKEMHERVHQAVSVIPASSWSKSHFSGRAHTDCLLNNLCEVFNAKIEDARDQPIITCLEYIREYLMKRLCVVQAAINKCEILLTPTATQLFEVIKKEAARYVAQYNGAGKYQVGCPWQDQYVVDLNDRSCTCRNWEITGMPCKHAVAAIWDRIANSEDSSPVEEYIGRPKKKRKRGVDEDRGQTSNLSRRYVPVTCAKCGNKGHNSRTCKGQGELVIPEQEEHRGVW
ncbi:hypothetical protein LXL04_030751 [Taraxacum kok-saghyz]